MKLTIPWQQTSKDMTKALVKSTEFTVRNHNDGYEIPCKLRLASSKKNKLRASVLLIHGGMFSKGDRESHAPLAEALAGLGLAVLTATFRDGSTTTHNTGITFQDLSSLVAYMKETYSNIPFGLIGSSSGGYFALALACSRNEHALLPGTVDFCVPICPVANPHTRAMYLRHCIEGTTPLPNGKDPYPLRHDPTRAKEILENQLKYWENYKSMSEAGKELMVNVTGVPTLLILGSADRNIPPQVTHRVEFWATRTIVVGGAGHEIQTTPPSDPKQSYLEDVDRFLHIILEEDDTALVGVKKPWCC